jgi:hypothetical protein
MSTNTIDTQEPTEAQSSQPRPTLSLVFEQQFLGVPNGSRLQTRDRTRGYHGPLPHTGPSIIQVLGREARK